MAGLLCAALLAQASAATPHSYRFEIWNTERGLPQNTVLSIVQTRDGYLWIGTRFGLARFDGVRFTTFNVANTPGMPCENCYTMAEDADGALWVGTNEGLMRRKNDVFSLFTTEHQLSHNAVRRVWPGPSGALWVGTSQGFSRFRDGQFTNLLHLVGPITNRTEILEDRSGGIWYSTYDSLFRLPPGAAKPKLIAPAGHPAGARAHFFLEDARHDIWFGNFNGLFRYSNGSVEHFVPQNLPGLGEISPRVVEVAFQTRAGELWVTVSDKNVLHRFVEGKFIPFPGPGGAPIQHVNTGLEDREGNIWIGTRFNGLIAAQHGVVSVLSTREGLPHDNVLSLCAGRDGAIWAGTSEGHLSRVQDRAVKSFAVANNYPWDVASVFQDAAGVVWLGIKKDKPGPSLFRLRDGTPEPFDQQAGISADSVYAIYQDRSSNLWFGASDGLHRYRDGRAEHFTTQHGLSSRNVRAIFEDRSGALWIGTHGGGVNILRDGQFTALTTRHGLASNKAWVFYEDADGAIWIGTETGLNRYRNGAFFTFTRKQGMFDDLVNWLVEDELGNLWISCNRGISRVNRQELNAVADGRAASVRHIAYGVSDGMLSSETNGENQPAGCKTRDGRLWFPTIQGVASIDPSRAQDNSVEPAVVIEQVTADGEVMLGNGLIVPRPRSAARGMDFTLGARRGQFLQIQYTANSFVSADKVRFKYRLEGHDRDWRDAGTDRIAYYTNLQPGDYRFRVLAANSHDRWNNRGAAVVFSIAPHYTQTAAFWIVIALLVAGLLLAGHLMRLHFVRRLQRAEQFQAVELERKRIAKDMHDDLGSSLTQISLLTELASRDAKEPEDFKTHLNRIGETTRGLFSSLDEIIWATNPRNDTLESLVTFIAKYAEDFLHMARIACRLDFPQTLPPLPVSASLRHDLLLVVKEALTNIVKHSGATEVWVKAAWAFPDLELTIKDNGRGMLAAPKLPHEGGLAAPKLPREGGPSPSGDGLINMKQRLHANGGELSFENVPSGGTLVRIIIPACRAEASQRRPVPRTTTRHAPLTKNGD